MTFVRKIRTNCMLCGLLPENCICASLPKIDTLTRLHLLIHTTETGRSTNSGQIAASCLINSRVEVFGKDGWFLDSSRFKEENKTSVILFPEGGKVLSDNYLKTVDGKINLIVPDGNWKQARKMYRKVMNQSEFPTVRLPDGVLTSYHLRKEPRVKDGLATFEAIAMAIGCIEGQEKCNELLAVFDHFVDLHLENRGKKRSIPRHVEI